MSHSHTFSVVCSELVSTFLIIIPVRERKPFWPLPPHTESGNTNESDGTHLAACWNWKLWSWTCVCVFSARDEQMCPQAGICVCVLYIFFLTISVEPDQLVWTAAFGVFQVAIPLFIQQFGLLHTFSCFSSLSFPSLFPFFFSWPHKYKEVSSQMVDSPSSSPLLH